MNVASRALSAAALATLGVLALGPSAAQADPPAPDCASGLSKLSCEFYYGGVTGAVTWHITLYMNYNPSTTEDRVIVTDGPLYNYHCYYYRTGVKASYSYVANGQTITSATTAMFACNEGTWE